MPKAAVVMKLEKSVDVESRVRTMARALDLPLTERTINAMAYVYARGYEQGIKAGMARIQRAVHDTFQT